MLKDALYSSRQSGALQILNKYSSEETWNSEGSIKWKEIENLCSCVGPRRIFAGRLNYGLPIAVKRIRKTEYPGLLEYLEATSILPAHPNVVQYFCAEERREHIYMAYEMCNISLDRLKEDICSHDTLRMLKILLGATKGLHFLHENRIIHGRLTPSRLVIKTNNDVFETGKLIYDISEQRRATQGRKQLTDNKWMAPERLESHDRTVCLVMYS